MADDTLALVQHQTKLYLVDAHQLARDLFYQQVSGRSFSNLRLDKSSQRLRRRVKRGQMTVLLTHCTNPEIETEQCVQFCACLSATVTQVTTRA